MSVLKYYAVIQNEIRIRKEDVNAISVHNSLNQGLMCAFFVASNGQIKCRSPPFINLLKKIQIDRRKEKWQNALKEENIKIIHIH